MQNLIILLLLALNPVLILDTPMTAVSNNKTTNLYTSQNIPRLVDNSTTISWIKSHQKKDAGYGRLDSSWSHGSWTYAAVHALTLLDKTRTDSLASPEKIYNTMMYVQSLGMEKGYSTFENIYTLILLDYEPFNKQAIVLDLVQTNLTSSSPAGIYYKVAALKLLGHANRANLGAVDELVNWLTAFQNPDGGWDNIRSNKDPYNLDGTSYVTYTWYAAMTLSYLNVTIPNNETIIEFIQSCQNPDGGFGNRPDGLGSSSDVYYTFVAIQTLELFDEKPVDVGGTIRWLNRLQNYDGGFGDKPGWNSRLYSTYYAIHSLIMLNGTVFEKIKESSKLDLIPATHHVFSFGMEVSNQELYSSESVLIADDLGLDLIGLKSKDVKHAKRANEFAEYYNLSARVILTPESYAERIDVKGLGRFSHVADILYPPDGAPGRGGEFKWQEYKIRIKQGHESDALFFIGPHTRDFDYMIIDDSLETHSGYNLIQGGTIQGENVVCRYPWFERWIGKIPMVSNTDAHREFWELRGHFQAVRTLFIAPNSTWEGFKDSVLKNRVVIAFKTANTPGFDDIVLYGSTEAIYFLQDHRNDWIWWESPYPRAVITPITHGSSIVPDNSYEWDLGNFTGTILRIKGAKFKAFKLDGQQLYNQTFIDRTNYYKYSSFYYVHLERILNGTHVAEVEYVSGDGLRYVKTLIFDIRYPSLYLRELTHFPAEPTDKDSIKVSITAIERVPAKHVILWYSIDGKLTWNAVSMSKDENMIYSAVIGKMPPETTVYYYVEAVDKADNSIRLPQNNMDYESFVIFYQQSPKDYTHIFTFSVILIVSFMSFYAEFHWNRKARKHS